VDFAMKNKQFNEVVDFGCGMFNEFLKDVKPRN